MTIRTATLQADLRTIPDAVNVGRRSFVAIPPSDADSLSDEMRVVPGGVVVLRAFDPGQPVVTGAPVALVTMTGEPLVTIGAEPYVTVVE